MRPHHTPEQLRLDEDSKREKNWKRWGPYLSERQWGTVREDYSANGDAWNYFPHDHARSRAYRWGEDGLLGFSDRECRLCFGLALWNQRDPYLKERLYGLTNPQGNHGEDVKEWYWYLDSTPTHSYAKALYKYPQSEYPYARLIEENAKRSKIEREFEVEDAGAFDESRYFDVFAEYAKASPDDILIRITIANRGPESATIHVLPTLWFRNIWTWGAHSIPKPHMDRENETTVTAMHATIGRMIFEIADPAPWLFTENDTNCAKLFGSANASPYVKDAFHEFVVNGRAEAVNLAMCGTKTAAHYVLDIPAGEQRVLKLRLRHEDSVAHGAWVDFDKIFTQRVAEATAFYESRLPANLTEDQARVVRQAYAGLLWSKQYYEYVIKQWLDGDPATPKPPPGHAKSRNSDWPHLFNSDVVSMPDKWEYPWYAAWDLAFHMIPFARLDRDFAKGQLQLFLREWYMHPNGQIPAYEWNFADVNPPVHAWACWRAYKISAPAGKRDGLFLERCFQKLLLNFTWWVNRKDPNGKNIFGGGFLGLDNIGLFDRSNPLPSGRQLQQADGTAWMAFYCATMLSMALELARTRPAYEDIASKFFEHFVDIIDAMNNLGGDGLWNEEDGFYYDQILVDDGTEIPLRVRSLVGIIPLLAVEVLDQEVIKALPGFRKRMRWFVHNRPELAKHVAYMERCPKPGAPEEEFRILAIPSKERLIRVLRYVLDEKEFLSPYGVRSLSAAYKDNPFVLNLDGSIHSISYEPSESRTGMFGGNSNWRGPIWFPINYLLIEALEKYHHFYRDDIRVECPTGSGNYMNLQQVALEIATRMARLFLKDESGRRPCYGEDERFVNDPHWRDYVQFHEYFQGDTGRGLGASHQTGWTALITRCVNMVARVRED
jgi:hypothetical protein